MNFVIYYGSTKHQNMKKVLDILTKYLNTKGHSFIVVESNVNNCVNCGKCLGTRECCIKDNFPIKELSDCDGIIILSPIFFFSFSAKAKSFIDRLYSVNLEGKIFTSITLSGSVSESVFSGFDLVRESIIRISEYCGCNYIEPINFVTNDMELKYIDESVISEFVNSLGGVS